MHIFKTAITEMHYARLGDENPERPLFIWAHGWGQDHSAFLKLAASLQLLGEHIIIDFPGFGASPAPPQKDGISWGSRDYADFAADFIRSVSGGRKVIWIGHSFGCRVGTQLGAHYPDLIEKMVYIAGAGLKRRRGIFGALRLKMKVFIYKVGKLAAKLAGISPDKYAARHGSSDYQKAGSLRGTLISVVNENLKEEARQITCPVLLLYGDKDTETPMQIGKDYNQLISLSEMVSLDGQDHYSVLGDGRHTVAALIKTFVEKQRT